MRPRSRLTDATWTAFTEVIRFVVVPIVLVDLVTTNYPQLTHAFMPEIKTYILFFGGMIAASSTLEAINKPGTFKRLLFGWVALAFICMWLFVIFGGGVAEFTYGGYTVHFDISKIVYIMLVGISLKGLLVYSTYSTHKQLLKDQAREKKLEALRATAAAKPRRPSRRRPAVPSFESMSKMAYEVTPDEAVGYEPPPPPPAHRERTLANKECPVCGTRASPNDVACKNCGAWFSKDTVR